MHAAAGQAANSDARRCGAYDDEVRHARAEEEEERGPVDERRHRVLPEARCDASCAARAARRTCGRACAGRRAVSCGAGVALLVAATGWEGTHAGAAREADVRVLPRGEAGLEEEVQRDIVEAEHEHEQQAAHQPAAPGEG